MTAFDQMAAFCVARAGVDSSDDDLVFEITITHIYAPTGKTATMVRLLRDNPGRGFTSADLGAQADVHPKNVSRLLSIARGYGLLTYEPGPPALWQWA